MSGAAQTAARSHAGVSATWLIVSCLLACSVCSCQTCPIGLHIRCITGAEARLAKKTMYCAACVLKVQVTIHGQLALQGAGQSTWQEPYREKKKPVSRVRVVRLRAATCQTHLGCFTLTCPAVACVRLMSVQPKSAKTRKKNRSRSKKGDGGGGVVEAVVLVSLMPPRSIAWFPLRLRSDSVRDCIPFVENWTAM